MATPKKPSTPANETAPAKKAPRKRAAAKAAEAPEVDAAPAATPDTIALQHQIRQRAHALYLAGSHDTLGNWLQAEREILGR